MTDKIAAKEAKYGQKMIEVKVRFWTNGIADGENKIIPKHAWDKGVVRIASNKSHGITETNPIPFNSLLDVGRAIERCLMNNGVTLKLGSRTRKYMTR